MNNLIAVAQEAFKQETAEVPAFKAGDTITVTIKIREGNKERLQNFRGVVRQRRGTGVTETFTIRKISDGIGVERIFPVNSPTISKIELNKVGVVRRARIYYLRDLTGKKARIKEKNPFKWFPIWWETNWRALHRMGPRLSFFVRRRNGDVGCARLTAPGGGEAGWRALFGRVSLRPPWRTRRRCLWPGSQLIVGRGNAEGVASDVLSGLGRL